MKKALVIMMLVMAAPLYAVTGSSVDNTDGTCTVTIPTELVALGLDVTCSAGEIDGVAFVDSFFDVFMDAAYDEEAGDGYTYGEGSPVADPVAPGELTLPLGPLATFCISAGGLGELTPATPPATVVITLSSTVGATGTIDVNALRGGMVDAAGANVVLDAPIPFVISPPPPLNCMVALGVDVTHPTVYASFLAAEAYFGAGAVDCWCDEYNCAGDADRLSAGAAKKWVTGPDLTLLSAGWLKKQTLLPAASICADSDRVAAGAAKKWVTGPDLTILSDNWLKKQTLLIHVPCEGYGKAPE